MISSILKTILAIALFVFVDYIWLANSTAWLYTPVFAKIQQEPPRYSERIIGGVYAWVLLGIGIVYFVLPVSFSFTGALLNGLVYGLIVYGVYNGTNFTTFNEWALKIWFFDNLWGMIASAFVSGSLYLLNVIF